MQLVAQVEQLKRQRRKARERRLRTRIAPPRDPGRLLDFYSEVSPDMIRPRWLAPIADEMERIPTEPIELCFSVPPRYGKPVREDTRVTMADGSLRAIRDLRPGDRVISGAGRPVTVTALHDQGELDVLRVVTRSGREVFAEKTHGFLAAREVDNRRGRARACEGPKRSWIEEWKEAGDLVPQPRRTRARNRAHSLVVRSDLARETTSLGGVHVARFLGYIVGDGGVTTSSVNWTNVDPGVRAMFTECAAAIGCTVVANDHQTLRVNSPEPRRTAEEQREYHRAWRAANRRGEKFTRPRRSHRARMLLEYHGVMGCGAYEKRVPEAVFSAPDDEVAAFLAAYFECDGSKAYTRNGKPGQQSHYASVSHSLLDGVRTLLGRLGIRSNLYQKRGKYKGEVHLSWILSVLDDARFFDLIPVVGAKAGPSARCRRFEPDGTSLRDPIVSVEPAGRARCYCISVDQDASFIANDVVTHNSTLTFHLIAWLLAREPRLRILYVSYAQTFAEEQIALAKTVVIAAGVTLGAKQTEKKWTTRAGGSVTAAGMDGQLAGRGFHVVICDDPHKNIGDTHSRRIREGVVRSFKSDVWTRKIPKSPWWPGTSFLLLHTRWHPEDTIGVLSDPKLPKPWPLINLPAINDETGEVLAPELWSAEVVENDRRIGEYEFSALHLGQPRPVGGTTFGDVATIDTLGEGAFRYAIGLDIARSARTRADWNVAVVMRRNVATGEIDVVDVRREQGTLSDKVTGRGDEPQVSDGFQRTLHTLSQQYPGAPIHMYGAKDETLLIALMARHDRYPVKVRHTLATSKKWLRAQPYATAWNDPKGKLRVLRKTNERDRAGHLRDQPWFDTFVREHMNFTGADSDGERDDQVDAAAAAFDALMAGAGGRTKAGGTGEGSRAMDMGRAIVA